VGQFFLGIGTTSPTRFTVGQRFAAAWVRVRAACGTNEDSLCPGLVWGIGLRRLGCGCGRRLVTGSCVYLRSRTTPRVVRGLGRAFRVVVFICETTPTGCPRSRPRVSLSIYLSISPRDDFGRAHEAASIVFGRARHWGRPPLHGEPSC
jgi:hypothetical protein